MNAVMNSATTVTVKNRTVLFNIKRFLHLNKGLVLEFDKTKFHRGLGLSNEIIHSVLKTLSSLNYVKKYGNWRHAWYAVTEDGEKMLKEEVARPDDGQEAEDREIKH